MSFLLSDIVQVHHEDEIEVFNRFKIRFEQVKARTSRVETKPNLTRVLTTSESLATTTVSRSDRMLVHPPETFHCPSTEGNKENHNSQTDANGVFITNPTKSVKGRSSEDSEESDTGSDSVIWRADEEEERAEEEKEKEKEKEEKKQKGKSSEPTAKRGGEGKRVTQSSSTKTQRSRATQNRKKV